VIVGIHRGLHRLPVLYRQLVAVRNDFVGERRVNAVILEITRHGDCVWDVGANVGFYTRQLLKQVGPAGKVVAFEPIPSHAKQLLEMAAGTQLTVFEGALAASDGEMPFTISGENGEMSAIGSGSGAVTVRTARGDSLIAEGFPSPDVLKIDVEGFEGDVLDGMPGALGGARAVVVEVHFQALIRRGIPNDPIRVQRLLRGHGFALQWVDSSHLVATR
jgi:FkbM family methyltransferase